MGSIVGSLSLKVTFKPISGMNPNDAIDGPPYALLFEKITFSKLKLRFAPTSKVISSA